VHQATTPAPVGNDADSLFCTYFSSIETRERKELLSQGPLCPATEGKHRDQEGGKPMGECFKPKTHHLTPGIPPVTLVNRPPARLDAHVPCTAGSSLCFPAFIYDLYVTSLVARSNRASQPAHRRQQAGTVPFSCRAPCPSAQSASSTAARWGHAQSRMRGPPPARQNAVKVPGAHCRCWRLPTQPTVGCRWRWALAF
jgi:hypothetical protein